MTKTIEKHAETTSRGDSFDVVGDALASLRIGGSLLLREAYSPPWAVAVPAAGRLAALLGVDTKIRVVAFHLVEFGQCEIESESGSRVLLNAGEMAVCFDGAGHRISQGRRSRSQAFESLLGGDNAQRARGAEGTSLLCGAFLLQQTDLNPLFAALPGLMRASLSRAGELHNLSGVARLMAEEIDRGSPGGAFIIGRLLEVLCAEAVRAHIETARHEEAGWIRAIRDPVVGRAIAEIHARPGEPWSVSRLAQRVAMSPSRFAARFSEALGESPMSYVARWRMSVARRRLVASRESVERIASDIGYESSAAFIRAFQRRVGATPAAWRARERALAAAS